jgi:hypothetical protein
MVRWTISSGERRELGRAAGLRIASSVSALLMLRQAQHEEVIEALASFTPKDHTALEALEAE